MTIATLSRSVEINFYQCTEYNRPIDVRKCTVGMDAFERNVDCKASPVWPVNVNDGEDQGSSRSLLGHACLLCHLLLLHVRHNYE